tara:strand:- start:140 stop:1165 length:1026 start_codon:yes stop_codon:yes gene_type:complete
MAVGTQVVSSQNLKLLINHELTMGDTALNGGATRYQLPLLAPPSVKDLYTQLDSAPRIIGSYTLDGDNAIHNRYSQMQEISFSVLCSPDVLDILCLFMFEDGDGDNKILSNYSPPTWYNGVDTDYSASIFIGGGGYGNNAVDNDDVYYPGCIMKSLEITHAIDSEGGKPVANCVFVTGYNPTYYDGITDGDITGSWTTLDGSGAHSFTNWDDDTTYISASGAGYEIHPYSYSVSIARDIQRVGCVDFTNYLPNGYVMVGEMDISMNILYKRDQNFVQLKPFLNDSSINNYRIGDASNWTVMIAGLVSENSVDTGSPELRNSVTVKAMDNIEGTTALLTLNM